MVLRLITDGMPDVRRSAAFQYPNLPPWSGPPCPVELLPADDMVPYVALVRGRERSSDAAQGSPLGPRPASRHLGDLLLHPVALAALVVLVFNDHVAKQRWPSQVTGKASDVAGLLFFPLLLVAVVESVRWLFDRDGWPLGRRALLVAVLATGLGFAAVKLWGPAGDAYRMTNGLARWPLDAAPSLVRGHGLPPVETVKLVEDRTDLVALLRC